MKTNHFILIGFTLLACLTSRAQQSSKEIVFDSPAEKFTQAFPLGNGRIGALVFGGTSDDRISLNEISLWSGCPKDTDLPGASQYLKTHSKTTFGRKE